MGDQVFGHEVIKTSSKLAGVGHKVTHFQLYVIYLVAILVI